MPSRTRPRNEGFRFRRFVKRAMGSRGTVIALVIVILVGGAVRRAANQCKALHYRVFRVRRDGAGFLIPSPRVLPQERWPPSVAYRAG
ncbi:MULTISPECIES: hypothetical protein [unclassified Mycobacterium]|uniref:hypothetical protein n=1 Tax=unclassified Mycobacterium TaxID=2642494 RepID=UPI000800AC03|nr:MULTISPECIES: hypothetical protein [unclassified Mycobacterium]OBG60482.1 hypothetical protein A5703_25040 [Mycobacterium sp. E188]OBG81397.1 hypothetical protein A5701_00920 [Mycobacterium sp. E3305]OBH40044.1 hypothetical protein A5691_02255 [Mycobacterium sp. E183]OBG62427.1 hypothetical protein A5704_16715 [Mycobacterium sp. E735]OBG84869.1 hypothetical protein A9X05_17305 [Mycobacterium sp. E3298]